jgi:hypothetical protein
MLVYCVFFRILSVLLPDIPLLVSCSSVHPVSELVMYEMYLFGIGAGMEHHIGNGTPHREWNTTLDVLV